MNFLFVMDPLERIDVTKDTTFLFLTEAQRRGHTNFVCDTYHLMLDGPSVRAACAPVEVRPVQGDHFTLGEREVREAESFDAVFMRKDPPFDIDFFFATHLLSLVDERRTFVFNRASGLREATEKLFILRFPELIPETFVSADAERILAFADRVGGEAVVKPLEGCGGMGIFRIRRGDLNTPSILENVTREGRRPVMAQRYLPESRQGDVRLLYLDGEPLGAITRVPPEGDLRGNLHVGGRAAVADIGERERKICDALAPIMGELGLYFAGLDVIGGYLTEINVTSPTGIQEANRLSGQRLESKVIDFVEEKCRTLDR